MFHVEHSSALPLRPGRRRYSLLRRRKSPCTRLPRTTCYQAGSRRVGGTTKANIRSSHDIMPTALPLRTIPISQRRALRPKRQSAPTCYSSDSWPPRHLEEPIWIPLGPARREMRLRPTRGGAGHAGRALDRKPRRQIAATFPPVARPVINQSDSCLPRAPAPTIAASPPPATTEFRQQWRRARGLRSSDQQGEPSSGRNQPGRDRERPLVALDRTQRHQVRRRREVLGPAGEYIDVRQYERPDHLL